jgi:hypothetical protein
MLYYPQENSPENAGPNRPGLTAIAPERSNQTLFSAVIKTRETPVLMSTESVDVVSASHSGVGFYAQKECYVGQLISLMMPMPVELRRYDHDKKLYKIWGLVQHCSPLKGDVGLHIGVAFIGRNAPQSYGDRPMTSYRVSGVGTDGFWIIDESETPFKTRKHSRFWNTTEVFITAINSDGQEYATERTVTENISESGASIFSNLLLDVGDRIRITNAEHEFTSTAMVRNRQAGKDRRPRLHIEFVDATFPVAQLSGGANARKSSG